MPSRTSFFNPTLFWKNVTRFWPVWALYTVIWVIVLPLSALNRLRGGWWSSGFHRILLGDAGHFGIPMAALFGILTAMALLAICTRAARHAWSTRCPCGGSLKVLPAPEKGEEGR